MLKRNSAAVGLCANTLLPVPLARAVSAYGSVEWKRLPIRNSWASRSWSSTIVRPFVVPPKIAETTPDIVFVDIMMPRLDGYQTCSLIKHNKAYKNIPVIMLSSKDGLFDRARGRIVGSEHYLTKPFTKDELLSAIESQVEK
jgi:CheY-like chemotaxis protein